MNREVMFSSKTDLWETPQDLFDRLDAIYHFETDVCALPENAKCAHYYTPEDDGLSKNGRAFVGAIRLMVERSESGLKRQQSRLQQW